jgi:hypothetical protein
MDEQRRSQRVRVAFDALYSNGNREGAGQLVDFSYSGALVDEASLIPKVGTSVRVYVFVQPVAPFELIGEVVRPNGERGFALEFKELSPELKALVDDAAAIVSAVG